MSVLWLGKYAHKLSHRKQVHLRTSIKNSNEPWAIKTKNTGNKKRWLKQAPHTSSKTLHQHTLQIVSVKLKSVTLLRKLKKKFTTVLEHNIECTMTSVNVFEFQKALLSTADVNYNKYNVSSVNIILKHGWILSKYRIYLNTRRDYSLKFGA